MASLPFLPTIPKHRQPLTGSRRIIVVSAVGFFLFLLWAMLAHVDEVTAGQGKVIPSSKVQLIQATEAATVSELLVRSGQQVKKGQLLARLDNPQSRQIQAETEALQARSSRLASEGLGTSSQALAGEEATLSSVRRQALGSRVAALNASAEQRRREMAEAQATISSLRSSLSLAQQRVQMLEPLAA